MERKIVYFDKEGKDNTDAVLELVKERAVEEGIERIVLASTTGFTARKASDLLTDTGIKLVVIPLQYGFAEKMQFDLDLVPELEKHGHRVYWSTMLFETDALYGVGAPQALANMLRIFGQGMKVCVEILLMAADDGCLQAGEKTIAVAGRRCGADTAVLATASPSNRLKELKIHEILCKPLRI